MITVFDLFTGTLVPMIRRMALIATWWRDRWRDDNDDDEDLDFERKLEAFFNQPAHEAFPGIFEAPAD